MNRKCYFLYIFLVLGLIIGLSIMACDKDPLSHNEQGVAVNLILKSANGPQQGFGSFLGFKKKIVQKMSAEKPNSFSEFSFKKTLELTDAKVLVLDMTQWADSMEFLTAWDSTEQTELIDFNLWDDTKDMWNNYATIFKSYTGEYYRYHGEYGLTIQDSVAKGTVRVNPGLNYFFICLREDGLSKYYGAGFRNVEKDMNEPISISMFPTYFISISSPPDSSEFQQGQEIYFSGYAYFIFTEEQIPENNLVWTSDKDGELGRGSYFYKSDLSVNMHTITFTATTASGFSISDQVHITVFR